jgi:uncharacterized membrane protein YqjE
MAEVNHQPPGFTTLLGRLARTGVGAVQNRLELFAVEWQEERTRLAELALWVMLLVFLGILAVLLLTATVIFLFREELRIYVAASFTLIYIVGTIVAWFGIKSLLKREPFTETISQTRKDREWLDSLK